MTTKPTPASQPAPSTEAEKMLAMRADYDRQQGAARGLLMPRPSPARSDMPAERDLASMYKAQRDNLLGFIQNAPVASGVCCCGDDMKRHGNPMDCGHSPVDMWDHSVLCYVEEFAKFDVEAERVEGFDLSLAAVEAYDPQSFIDGAKWQARRATAGEAHAERPIAMSNAEAAQWARDNGLNFPPEWEQAERAPSGESLLDLVLAYGAACTCIDDRAVGILMKIKGQIARRATAGTEELALRRLLAYRVAGSLLYTDDGELQDNATPRIDFKRDSVEIIERKLIERATAGTAAAPSDEGIATWRERMPAKFSEPEGIAHHAMMAEIRDLRAALARSEESVTQYQQSVHELAEELRLARRATAGNAAPTENKE